MFLSVYKYVSMHMNMLEYTYTYVVYTCVQISIYPSIYLYIHTKTWIFVDTYVYEVATISRLLKIIGLFCKRAL